MFQAENEYKTSPHRSVKVVTKLVVKLGHILDKCLKLRNDQVIAEDLAQQGQVALEDLNVLIGQGVIRAWLLSKED